MSTESEGVRRQDAEADEVGAAARPRIAALALLLVVIAVAGLLLLRREGESVRPLSAPAARTLVVLLAPGASMRDWRDAATMPALAALSDGRGVSQGVAAILGLLPARRDDVPWRAEVSGGGPLWAPVTTADLVRASRALGGPPLGAALRRGGARVIALGADPAARSFVGEPPVPPPGAVAPLTSYEDQNAEQWRSRRPDAVDGFVTDPNRLAAAISRALVPPALPPGGAPLSPAAPCLVVATFDDLLRNDAYAPLALARATAARRREALGRLDILIGQLTGAGGARRGLPPGVALLVLTPVASTDAAAGGDLLGPALYWPGDGGPPSSALALLLTSPSTRHTPGLLATGDVAATVASLLGLPAEAAIGAGRGAEASAAGGDAAAKAMAWAEQVRARSGLIGLPWALAALLLLAAFARSRNRGGPPVTAALALAAGAAPLALLYLPAAGAASFAAVLLIAAIAGAWMARRGDGAGPALRVLCLLTALVVALLVILDSATGGAALAHCPLSYAPALGARYYGLGNELSGVLLGASLFAVAALGESGVLGIALGGAAVALLMGMPSLGADAGGFAAALVAYGTWVALRLAARCGRAGGSLRAAAGVSAVVLVLLGLFVLGNAALPSGARTHVGQAVVEARLGGAGAFAPTLLRKVSTDMRLLVTSPWSALLLVEGAVTGWLWRRQGLPGAAEERQAIIAACAGAGALLLLNDSGSAAAAACLLYPTARLLPSSPSVSTAGRASALFSLWRTPLSAQKEGADAHA